MLLGVLMFLRIRSVSGISSNLKGVLVFVLVVFLLTFRLIVFPTTGSLGSTESGRVQDEFKAIFSTLAKVQGNPTLLPLPPVRVDVAFFSDGSKASLWVPNFAKMKPRSNCLGLYLSQGENWSGGSIESLCSAPKSGVILGRQNSVVVGFIGVTNAREVSITVLDVTVTVPMVFGYFLVPGSFSVDPKTKYTITYTEPGSATCKVSNLVAPASSRAMQCVVA